MTKSEFRKHCISIEKTDDGQVLEKIIKSNILSNSGIVGIYYPLKNEYDILGLLDTYKDKTFVFPRVVSSQEIVFIKARNLELFEDTKFSMREPVYNESNIIKVSEIDTFIVPCVGISKGKRIGFGAGYYDRYLENNNKLLIGVVNKLCITDSVLMEDYDLAIDKVFKGE